MYSKQALPASHTAYQTVTTFLNRSETELLKYVKTLDKTDYTLVLLKMGVIVTVAILCAGAAALLRDGTSAWLLGCTTASVIMLAGPMFARKDYDTFEPLTFVLLLYIFGAPFKLLYVLYYGASSPYVAERLLMWKGLSSLSKGTGLMTLGVACLVIGYCLPLRLGLGRIRLLPKVSSWNSRRTFWVAAAITVVSGIFLVGFIASAGVSFSNLSEKRFSDEAATGGARIHMLKYYLYRGAALSKFAVYLLYVHLLVRRKPKTGLFGLLSAMALLQTIALFFVINSRAGIALILLDLLILTHYIKGRIHPVTLFGSLGGIFIMIVAALFGRAEHNLSEALEKTVAGRDMMDITKTCHIINAVPKEIPYRYGETLVGWMAAPIPRSLWSDKPMWAERGVYLLRHVYGAKGGIAGIPPGLVAELFWNLDVYGIVVGMFFFGICMRVGYHTFVESGRSPTSILLYTLLVTRFVLFSLGNDIGTGIVKTGLDLVPMFMLILLVRGTSSAVERRNQPSHGRSNRRVSAKPGSVVA